MSVSLLREVMLMNKIEFFSKTKTLWLSAVTYQPRCYILKQAPTVNTITATTTATTHTNG